ncbi:MAG TPA: hypothetical protein VFV50_01070 [Bdellovibrionales bacterium]|nr:hypothetical protein [Bdellovibrionales bacterium]
MQNLARLLTVFMLAFGISQARAEDIGWRGLLASENLGWDVWEFKTGDLNNDGLNDVAVQVARYVPANNPYIPGSQDTIQGLRIYFQQPNGKYVLAAAAEEKVLTGATELLILYGRLYLNSYHGSGDDLWDGQTGWAYDTSTKTFELIEASETHADDGEGIHDDELPPAERKGRKRKLRAGERYLMRDRAKCPAAKLETFNAYEFFFDMKICQ